MTVLIKIRLVFKSYTSKHHNKSNSFQIKLEGGNLHRGGLLRLVIGCIFLLSGKLADWGGKEGRGGGGICDSLRY